MGVPGILALDLGTSGAKATLVAVSTGRPTATAFHPYPTRSLPGGGVEQDPDDWLRAARSVVTECAAAHPDIAALAVTGQMQDLICLDASGLPLGPALLYSDTRAQAEAGTITAAVPDWDALTCNEQNATSNAAMFLRLRQHDDPRADAARVLFSPAGHLVHRLGLGSVVDATTASATGLWNPRTRRWSPEVCAAAGLPVETLPEVCSGLLGETPAGNVLNLPAGIPVVLAPGDAACTTLGIVGDRPGGDYLYLGSSGWTAQVRARLEPGGSGAVHQLALPGGGVLRIAAVLSAAATADWAREVFLGGISPAQADRLLEERGTRGFTGLLSLPSLRGERFPVRDDSLGAAVVGMTPQTRPLDLYAAVLEGVALGLSHGMDPGSDQPLAVVGGGANSAPWLRIIADVTGREVRTLPDADAALNGCALAAAQALDLENSRVTPLVELPTEGRVVQPDPTAHASYAAVHQRHRRLYDALGTGRR